MKSNTLINYLVQFYNVGTFPLNILIFIHYLQIYIIFRIFCNGTLFSFGVPLILMMRKYQLYGYHLEEVVWKQKHFSKKLGIPVKGDCRGYSQTAVNGILGLLVKLVSKDIQLHLLDQEVQSSGYSAILNAESDSSGTALLVNIAEKVWNDG